MIPQMAAKINICNHNMMDDALVLRNNNLMDTAPIL